MHNLYTYIIHIYKYIFTCNHENKSKWMSCNNAIVMIFRRTHCFHEYVYVIPILLFKSEDLLPTNWEKMRDLRTLFWRGSLMATYIHIFIYNIYTYVLYIFIIYIITYTYVYIYISLKSTQYDEKIEHTYLHIYSFETKTQRVLRYTVILCFMCFHNLQT